MTSNALVLATGGSGFVGSHCIAQLLEKGYRVRTTIRSLARADDVRKMLQAGGVGEEQVKGVEFCVVELMKDDGWNEACREASYVLHVASPFPPAAPKHEDELVVPAREVTLRALRAAKAATTVKRVVVTSSFAAIGYGHPNRTNPTYTEKDWTQIEAVHAYPKSKTVAERAAWDYIGKEGGEMKLAVVNPVAIFGPTLSKSYATSLELVLRLTNGTVPGLAKFNMGIVDVRDVADLHIRAMTDPKAAGQRYLAVSGDFMSMRQVALTLRERLGDKAKQVTTQQIPDFIIRVVGFFDTTVGLIVDELGNFKHASSEKAKSELGWQPRSREDAIVATAESLKQFGLLK
ncbi:hypothetical protein LTR56_014701 [Elasticomyces elasticus]|nr:hypothetical protein LTR22_024256 [Elasticomyces elasticus]KAK3635534.1 hypothetical protein LTR56_014701 [Elasticomyces elasticus]KAK4904834.1 hypothetical protein LTR49_025785 [Elasticomyces elasticus]KAK5744099.1 hypothetical protein LTS12_023600 [Elasticomyces elasticus]